MEPVTWKHTFQKPTGATLRPPPSLPPMLPALRPGYSARSSLKVRCPEIIVETIDWRDMMSSRIAA